MTHSHNTNRLTQECLMTLYHITLISPHSTTSKIAALEAKLRQMEESDVPVKRPRLSPHPLTHRHTLGDSRSVY